MSTLTISIVIVFIVGYAFIALESFTKVNKAAVALLMFAVCWALFMVSPESYVSAPVGGTVFDAVNTSLEHHLGSTSTTLFFLLGAMTIVEIIDQNGGFNFVRRALRTHSKRSLLWKITILTFFLSAILDNMTTTIVMVTVINKLVADKRDRLYYAALVVIAANAGGAFSPIGDVTTIMLWNKNCITSSGVISEIFFPSLIAVLVPALILQYHLHGKLQIADSSLLSDSPQELSEGQRKVVFVLGIGGLIFVPIFRYITDLPPFVGILLVLAVLWTTTEIFYARKHHADGMTKRVSVLLSHIDMSTILFFLGILMAVACLEDIGVLHIFGQTLNTTFEGNHYLVTGIIGILSSIIDNVPLVGGCMGMYPIAPTGDFATDGLFWQLLAYCAGVGGSLLIIGSAAGVVAMGIEKITFTWYLKNVTWIAFVGYLAGEVFYYFQNLVF